VNRALKAVVVSALAGAILMPLASLHALQSHLSQPHAGMLRGALGDAPVVLLLLTFALSFVPAIGVAAAALRWWRGAGQLQSLTSTNEPVNKGELPYRRIEAPLPLLLTAGVRRPHIYASTAAENALAESAFAAGLLHEVGHCRHRDVLWLFLLQICRGGYGWLPGVRRLVEQAQLRIECRADDYALAAGASRKDLFDAISLISSSGSASAGLSGEGDWFRLERLAWKRSDEPDLDRGAIAGVVIMVMSLPLAAHMLFLTVCDVRLT
jgi:hypothetical protein